ncbi:MAG: hypothetical protein MUF49_22365 [Oculatellaceae cyanobacterium Prado106]|jgi:hypothetical protein|nr:hypothetical protein [Oculatellaceae cyanobacterium Prado106]
MNFGTFLSLSGNTLITEAVTRTVNGIAVFVQDGPNWEEQTRLAVPDLEPDSKIVSLSISQNTILVVFKSTRYPDFLGSAYIFERDPNTLQWSPPVQINPPSQKINFGSASAMDGDTIVINSLQSRCLVYQRNPQTGIWTYRTKLQFDFKDDGFEHVRPISVDSNTIIIGVPSARGSFWVSSGAAYVFQRQPRTGKWRQQAKLTPRGALIGGLFLDYINPYQFGAHVFVQDDKILVGACTLLFKDGSSFFSSKETAAYFYQRDGKSKQWHQKAKIPGNFEGMGCSGLGIVADNLLISHPYERNPDNTERAIYLFDLKKYLTDEKRSN